VSSVSHYCHVKTKCLFFTRKQTASCWMSRPGLGSTPDLVSCINVTCASLMIELGLVPSALRRAEVNSLPRKEVIQPQLPLRLPCYDFVPVTPPTLGRYPPYGSAHGLQVLAAPMT
jgi:hypothetical protein